MSESHKNFTDKDVSVQFMKEAMTFSRNKSHPMNELMLNILGAVYQFERYIMKQRQAEGILIFSCFNGHQNLIKDEVNVYNVGIAVFN